MEKYTLKEEWSEKIKVIQRKNVVISKRKSFPVMTEFYLAPEEVRLDKNITWNVLVNSKEYLWNIDPSFLKDKLFVIELLKTDYPHPIYEGLSVEWKNDPEIINAMLKNRLLEVKELFYPHNSVRINGQKTHSYSNELLRNKELMIKILQKMNIYPIIKDLYKNDKEVSLTYIETYPNILSNLSRSMINFVTKNKDLVLRIVSATDAPISNYTLLPEKMRRDIDVIDKSIKKNIETIGKIPLDLISNKEFAMYLLERNAGADRCKATLYLYPENIRDDEEAVTLAIKKNGVNINYASQRLREKKELILLALSTCRELNVLKLSEVSLNDKELMKRFIYSSYKNYNYISPKLKSDPEIIEYCLNFNFNTYNQFSLEIKNDWRVILKTIEKLNGSTYDIKGLNFPKEVRSLIEYKQYSEILKIAQTNALVTQLQIDLEEKNNGEPKTSNKKFKI